MAMTGCGERGQAKALKMMHRNIALGLYAKP